MVATAATALVLGATAAMVLATQIQIICWTITDAPPAQRDLQQARLDITHITITEPTIT